MRAVLYLRMSRDAQDKSIGEQRHSLGEFAKARGYSIVREYIDEGISGDNTEKRIAFQKMIADCPLKQFECVLCWDQDRFGRFDPLEAGYWIKPMRDAGVWLETIAQGRIDWNDFAGRISWTVSQEGKHAFLRDIARNCLRGSIASVKRGKPVGKSPFGYERDSEGRYILGDPAEVDAVRRVFALRLDRIGYRNIAKRMNDEGHRSPSGLPWSCHAVKSILERELYTGTLVYGRKSRGKYQVMIDGKQEAPSGKKGKPLKIPNTHPAIIDHDLWHRASEIKKDAPKSYGKGDSGGAPLSGLLICGRCGANMFSQRLLRKDGHYSPQYICGAYHRGVGCVCCRARQDDIHKAVFTEITQQMIGENYQALLAAVNAKLAESVEQESSSAIARKISKLEAQISSATDRLLIVDARLVSSLESRIFAMQDELTDLRAQITQAPATPQLSASEIADWAWSLSALLQSENAPLIRARLKEMISKIVLNFEEGRKTKRGQGFVCTGGTIHQVDSNQLAFSWTHQRIWTFRFGKTA